MSFVKFLKEARLSCQDTKKFDNLSVLFLDHYYYDLNSKFSDEQMIEAFKNEIHYSEQKPAIVVQADSGDFCPNCPENQSLVLNTVESVMYCPECAIIVPFMDCSSSSTAYGDEVEYSSFSYKRINHLNEWLKTFQARESTPVPDQDLVRVMHFLRDSGVRDAASVSYDLVKKAQKKLKIKGCYGMQIWCKITGRQPLILTPEAEEKIKITFNKIQEPFDKHCPDGRKSFLSYPYVLYKLCQLLEYDDLLNYFYLHLLKGKDKLKKQEEVFEKICYELGWKFIPLSIQEEEQKKPSRRNDTKKKITKKKTTGIKRHAPSKKVTKKVGMITKKIKW